MERLLPAAELRAGRRRRSSRSAATRTRTRLEPLADPPGSAPQPLTQDPAWFDAKPVYTRDGTRDPLLATPGGRRTARHPRDPRERGRAAHAREHARERRTLRAALPAPRRDRLHLRSRRPLRPLSRAARRRDAARAQLGQTRNYFAPRWSPDGERVVAISTRRSVGRAAPDRARRAWPRRTWSSSTARGACSSTRRASCPTGCRRGASRASGRARATRAPALALCALIFALACAVYLPIREHEWLNYDDDIYVTRNAELQQGIGWEGVRWAFTTQQGANWFPLTRLSWMLDLELHGLDAGRLPAHEPAAPRARERPALPGAREAHGRAPAQRLRRGGLRGPSAARRIGRLGLGAQGRALRPLLHAGAARLRRRRARSRRPARRGSRCSRASRSGCSRSPCS